MAEWGHGRVIARLPFRARFARHNFNLILPLTFIINHRLSEIAKKRENWEQLSFSTVANSVEPSARLR
jgi:hypothetical protein